MIWPHVSYHQCLYVSLIRPRPFVTTDRRRRTHIERAVAWRGGAVGDSSSRRLLSIRRFNYKKTNGENNDGASAGSAGMTKAGTDIVSSSGCLFRHAEHIDDSRRRGGRVATTAGVACMIGGDDLSPIS